MSRKIGGCTKCSFSSCATLTYSSSSAVSDTLFGFGSEIEMATQMANAICVYSNYMICLETEKICETMNADDVVNVCVRHKHAVSLSGDHCSNV